MQYRCFPWHPSFHSPASGILLSWRSFEIISTISWEKGAIFRLLSGLPFSVPLLQASLVSDSGAKIKHKRQPVSVGQWWQYSIGTGEIPAPNIILNFSLVSLKCLLSPWILYQERDSSSLGLLVNNRERKWHRCFCRNGLIQGNLGACCIPLILKVSK